MIAKARVPIIKFTDTKTDFRFDISFDVENGPQAAEYIRNLITKMPSLRHLTVVLKLFLQQRDMNEVRSLSLYITQEETLATFYIAGQILPALLIRGKMQPFHLLLKQAQRREAPSKLHINACCLQLLSSAVLRPGFEGGCDRSLPACRCMVAALAPMRSQ